MSGGFTTDERITEQTVHGLNPTNPLTERKHHKTVRLGLITREREHVDRVSVPLVP
jgi:hypothetical protein